jgi:hypothetical protein
MIEHNHGSLPYWLVRIFRGGSILILIAAFSTSVNAQRPFQDAKGESPIFINNGGFAQFNVSDSSIRFGYLYEVNPNPWNFGFDVSAKVTGTKAGILEDNQLVPNFKVTLTPGKKYVFTRRLTLPEIEEMAQKLGKTQGEDIGDYFEMAPFDRLAVQIGYAYKRYTLVDPNLPFDRQVFRRNFHSPSLSLAYFIQLDGRNLFGVSAGGERSNNSNDLTEVEVRDITIPTDMGGGLAREVVRTRDALRGDYRESTRVFINTDYVWFPKGLDTRLGFLGLNFFTRSGLRGDQKGFRPGIGIFLSEEKKPTRVRGGASFSYQDGKASIALIAGFTF